jgi:hypothetical protein
METIDFSPVFTIAFRIALILGVFFLIPALLTLVFLGLNRFLRRSNAKPIPRWQTSTAHLRGWFYSRPFLRKLLKLDVRPEKKSLSDTLEEGSLSFGQCGIQFLENFNLIILNLVITAYLVLTVAYVLSYPGGLPAFLAHIMAATCRFTGKCEFGTSIAALGVSLVIMINVLIGYIAVIFRTWSEPEDDDISQVLANQLKFAKVLDEIRAYQFEYLPDIHRHTNPPGARPIAPKKVQVNDEEE